MSFVNQNSFFYKSDTTSSLSRNIAEPRYFPNCTFQFSTISIIIRLWNIFATAVFDTISHEPIRL